MNSKEVLIHNTPISLDEYNPGMETSLVIVHGITSSKNQENTKAVANLISQQHITVYTYNLAGHGDRTGDPYDLQHHIAEVSAILAEIKKTTKRVFLLGASFGGLISFLATQRNPWLNGTIFLNAFLNRYPPQSRFTNIYWKIKFASWFLPKKHPYVRETEKEFNPTKILVPTLFIQGGKDVIIHPKEITSILTALPCESTLQILPELTHDIRTTQEQIDASKAITTWIG